MTAAASGTATIATVPRTARATRLGLGAAAVVVAGLIPLIGSTVFVLRATEVFAFMVAFAGLHVLSGRLGLISIGHGAFIGIGALGAAHAIDDLGLPYLLAPLAAGLVAALFGALIALPSLRLPGTYLALLTVAVAMALPIMMRRIDGPLGVRIGDDLRPPAWTGIDPGREEIWQYLMVIAVGSAVLGLMSLLLGARFGRSLLAVRDEPLAAAAFGVHVARTHVLGVALACALAGVAGGLLVYATPYVAGDQYTFDLSLALYALMVGFGSRQLWTVVPAAIVLVMLPELLVHFGWSAYQPVVYGVLLLVATRLTGGHGFGEQLLGRLRPARDVPDEKSSAPELVFLDPDPS